MSMPLKNRFSEAQGLALFGRRPVMSALEWYPGCELSRRLQEAAWPQVYPRHSLKREIEPMGQLVSLLGVLLLASLL
jgi:hypothetical protein